MDNSMRQDDGEPSYKHSKTMGNTWQSLLLKIDPINIGMYILALDKYDRAQKSGRHSTTVITLLHTLLEVWARFLKEDVSKPLQDCITSKNAPELYTKTFDATTMQALRSWLKDFTTPSTLPASTLPLPPGMMRPSLTPPKLLLPYGMLSTSLLAQTSTEDVVVADEPSETVNPPAEKSSSILNASNGVPEDLVPGTPPPFRPSRQSHVFGRVTRADNDICHIHLASGNSGRKVIKLETYNLSDVKDIPAEDWNQSGNSCQCLVLAEESSEVWRLSEELRKAIEKMLEDRPEYEYTRKRRFNLVV